MAMGLCNRTTQPHLVWARLIRLGEYFLLFIQSSQIIACFLKYVLSILFFIYHLALKHNLLLLFHLDSRLI